MSSIELNPPEMLKFELGAPGGGASKSTLTVINKGDKKIAFKVKTTKPRRYLVRPNQGLVDVGGSTDVTVILQVKDADELVDKNGKGEPLGDSTDKFLVQSAAVEDSFYDATIIKPAKDQTDDLSTMWASADKKTFTNKKLKCEFVFGAAPMAAQVQISKSAPAVSAPAPASGSSFDEMTTLRKKYDELVAFDAELMAERDKIKADLKKKTQELDEAKTETGLRNRKGGAGAGAAAAGGAADTKKGGMSFALVHLIIVAAIFFIFGRLLS